MRPAPKNLLTDLLRSVSRSFYLTMRVLPGDIRPQISLAYLLARASDTIADTKIVPAAERLGALHSLRERVFARSDKPLDFRALAGRQRSVGEQVLLERFEEALAVLNTFSYSDQQRVREVLEVIISGQELDLRRFARANGGVTALATDAELDDYTYRVAGCVGEFWTKMCRGHLFPNAPLADDLLLTQGARFGKGLQLVNILRDLPADLRQGRCYLPRERLAEAGLEPVDLLLPRNEVRLKPLYEDYLRRAESHLAAGWEYTNSLPFRHARVRLACAWPILIGMDTLAKLRRGRVLDPQSRVKVSRDEVRAILWRTVWLYPLPRRWRGLLPAAPHPG